MDAMLQTKDLSKTYKLKDGARLEAVKGVDLEIQKGEIFSLLGPNGAGKTTTISMISGLLEPSRGDAWIGGFSITKNPLEAKKLLGVVPQEVALYPSLSAKQNLTFFGRLYGLSGVDLKNRVDEILDFLELKDRADEHIERYSGGMKRRINIGVGLLNKPAMIYMDEPTVGIDPQSRRRILDMVKQLRDEQQMTVLYTTHLMEEAQELSNRVAIIDHGEIIALGTQGDLIQQVGEEDRLIFNIGQQIVPPELLEQMKETVPSVTESIYDPPGEAGELSDNQDGLITVCAKRGRKALPDLIQLIEKGGVEIQSVEVREPDLEAVFLNLTGRALRD